MGNGLGKKTKNTTKTCKCVNNFDNHCCKHQCFPSNKSINKTKKALTKAIKKYGAEYIVDSIIKFLPHWYNLVYINNWSDFVAICHWL